MLPASAWASSLPGMVRGVAEGRGDRQLPEGALQEQGYVFLLVVIPGQGGCEPTLFTPPLPEKSVRFGGLCFIVGFGFGFLFPFFLNIGF